MHEGKAKALNGGYKHVFLWQGRESGAAPTATYKEIKDVFPEEVARGWTIAMGAAAAVNTISNTVTAVVQIDSGACASSQPTTAGSGRSCISAERMFVSSRITS